MSKCAHTNVTLFVPLSAKHRFDCGDSRVLPEWALRLRHWVGVRHGNEPWRYEHRTRFITEEFKWLIGECLFNNIGIIVGEKCNCENWNIGEYVA